MDLTWFPNSWIRIRAKRRVIYIDPAYLKTYFSNYPDKTEFSSWPDPIDGLPNGLETAGFIFITHHHKDHCKKVTTQRLSDQNTKVYAPSSCKKELGNDFQIVKPGDQITIAEDLQLEVVNAYNTDEGSSTHKQHKKGKGVGYILTVGGYRIYHAGDTDLIPDMNDLRALDVLLIPMGGKFTMDLQEAIRATLIIKPKLVIPIHHLKANPEHFCSEKLRMENIQCIAPKIGQPIDLEKHH